MNLAIAKKIPGHPDQPPLTGIARELFVKHGFLKITMDDIASCAGISKKTIYRDFDNKDQLVNTCIAEEIDQTHLHIAIVLASDIGYAEKWDYSIRLITRRSHEAAPVFYRDILSRPEQIQFFNKKKDQASDLILNGFAYCKNRQQLAIILNSFLTLLFISVSGQPGGADRRAFMQTIVPFYSQAYELFEQPGVWDKNQQLLN